MKAKIDRIVIEKKIDSCPDTSFLGEYSDKPEEYSIIASSGEFLKDHDLNESVVRERNRYLYFNSSLLAVDKSASDEIKRSCAKGDFERMEGLNNDDWCFIGIVARAYIEIPKNQNFFISQQITSPGLWGIESNSSSEYFEEVAREELSLLSDMLLSLGFGKRAIAYAVKRWNGEFIDR